MAQIGRATNEPHEGNVVLISNTHNFQDIVPTPTDSKIQIHSITRQRRSKTQSRNEKLRHGSAE